MNDPKERMNPNRRQKTWTIAVLTALLSLGTSLVFAGQAKPFPPHWGDPPAIQTRDYVELPDGYGHGSSTLANWIKQNLARDQTSASVPTPLYQNDFESVAEGKVPEDFLVLNGDFAVRTAEGNKVLELPGAPVESFALQFGPAQSNGLQVSARISGTSTGRRYPVFGVGLSGVAGYKLKVNPARRTLELTRGDDSHSETLATTPLRWRSGSWTHFLLQVRPDGEGTWQVEGKVWADKTPEPTDWQVSYTEHNQPINGRPSILGSPYSGTPILYDDLLVRPVGRQD